MKLLCWWFGCDPEEPSDVPLYSGDYYYPPLKCKRCRDVVPYSDLVGDTRHNRAKQWANYWLFRKWFPKRCLACGNRWVCDKTISHEDADIPF